MSGIVGKNAGRASGIVGAGDIGANAVGLDEMAGGTDGNIISYDASGDPVAIATGNDGQVLTSSGANTQPAFEDAAGGGFTLSSETDTTSGTTFNIGSIPTGTKLIIINFNGVSLDGSAAIQVQIGDSGGIETSGYVSSSGTLDDDDTITHSSTTASFIIRTLHGYAVVNMRMVLSLTNSSNNSWHSFHGGAANNNESTIGGGTKSLSAELTQIQILDTGSDSFDAGNITIAYQ